MADPIPVRTGPCDWGLQLCDDPAGDCPDDALSGLSVDLREQVELAATEYLWRFTGRRFGLCSVTVRPCFDGCGDPCDEGWSGRHIYRSDEGGWTQGCGGGCGDACGCGSVCEVVLPGPVHDVTEVKVDGIPLLPVEWRVDDHRKLVRQPWTRVESQPVGTQGGNRYDYEGHGLWSMNVSGWAIGPDVPTSQSAGDIAQTQWPGAPSGVAGQYLRLWVPPLTAVQITTPERGVTISRTQDPDANGVYDDDAGSYSGGSEGTEYVIRFDGDQAVEWTPDGAGVEVRAMGFYVPGGSGCWPTCQDWGAPSSGGDDQTGLSDGTWEVTYRVGTPVPAGGRLAAGVLANELAKAVCGDSSCRLPQRVQTITRQGVTVAMLDESAGMDGATGIWLVDSWVQSVTAPHRTMGSRVFSPDVSRPRRTTHAPGV